MAASLASIRDRVEAYLQDSTNLVYDTGTLDEVIRIALSDYNMAKGTITTLAGLDGAAVTTVPAEHETVLVVGSAGYAVTSRAIRRSESYQMSQKVPKEVIDWGNARLAQFSLLLERVRTGDLRVRPAVETPRPWAEAGWLLDQWDGS